MKLADVKKINLARFADKRKNQEYLNDEIEYLASEKSLSNNKNNNQNNYYKDVNFDEVDRLRSSIVLTNRDEVSIRKIQQEVERAFLNDRANRSSGYNNAKNINPKLLQKLREEQDRLNRPIDILANNGRRNAINNRYEEDTYEEDFRMHNDYKNQAVRNSPYYDDVDEEDNYKDEDFDNLNPMEKRILSIVMPRVEDMIEIWAEDNLSEMIADIVQDEIERLYRKNKQGIHNYEDKKVASSSHDYINSDYISKILDSLSNKPIDNNKFNNNQNYYDNNNDRNDNRNNDFDYAKQRNSKRRDFESKKLRPRDQYEALFGNPSTKNDFHNNQDYRNQNDRNHISDGYQNKASYNEYYGGQNNASNNKVKNDSYNNYYSSNGNNNYEKTNYEKKDAMYYLTGKNQK